MPTLSRPAISSSISLPSLCRYAFRLHLRHCFPEVAAVERVRCTRARYESWVEITKVPPSTRGFQPLLIWSPRFRHRVSSRKAEEKTAARTHPSVREAKRDRGKWEPVSQGCKGKRRIEREKSCARAGRNGEGHEEAGWRNEGRVRIGGGLKGSERLNKSNPLKVRPTLCLPMWLRTSQLCVPDSLKGASRKVGRRERPQGIEQAKRRHRTRLTKWRAVKKMSLTCTYTYKLYTEKSLIQFSWFN